MAAIAAALPLREYSSTASIGRHLPRSGGYYLHFGFSRRTSIVRTESNVHKEKVKKPNPPCVVCCGSGRVDCRHCEGRGRTNLITLAMLPKGEWPRWCKVCGGSGLGYCSRCLGTGEYRDLMGFHFMKRADSNST
ncbi:hypothetical protein KSP39_PZI001052 [Platanthera zijinensis]|uniref:Uncharacterized protein n=1 Tax=Platanthera zijinensis TaxID=2320716 RepID=A0AAP0C4P4_9ASPA